MVRRSMEVVRSARFCRLQLEGRVADGDREVFCDAGFERLGDFGSVAIVEAPVLDDHVCSENRQARRDLRDVQIVDVDHVFLVEEVLPNGFEVDPSWHRLQQHVHGITEQSHRARNDENTDEKRGDRIGLLETGGGDHDSRNDDGHRSERVVENLEERRPHIEILAPPPGQHDDRR